VRLPARKPAPMMANPSRVSSCDCFSDAVSSIRKAGIDTGLVHAANSGAVIAWPELSFDMVRPGILVYGYYPSRNQERVLPVIPVMELLTKVVFLKRVERGTPISYGMTYITRRDTVIATLPVGYGTATPASFRQGRGIDQRRTISRGREGLHGSHNDRPRPAAERKALR